MKKLISLLLAMVLLAGSLLFTVACGESEEPPTPPITDVDDDGGKDDEGGEGKPSGIVVPTYKDYRRGTIDFDKIVYSRPDFAATVARFDEVTAMIEKNDAEYEEQLRRLRELDAIYVEATTMGTLANIYNSKDASVTFWSEEYEYISTSYPLFTQAIERLFVAAARSAQKERFEEDYFGDGELDEYESGGIYTDELVALMEAEAELEARYSSISTANTIITFDGRTDTYDNIIAHYLEKYGESSRYYLAAKAQCDILYEDAVYKTSADLLVELVRARRRIADELGYESYEQFAYETLYHDYSPEDARVLVNEIVEYIIPVYRKLYSYVFYPFMSEYEATARKDELDATKLINTMYGILGDMDAKLGDIYAYMLQHGLYDVAGAEQNRFDGSFTTYLDKYEAPFLFLGAEGTMADYLTLAHEFGHFADGFINYGASASLDVAEISSQALELIVLTRLGSTLGESAHKYLTYSELDSVFGVMIYQSFYASFEMEAYALDYDDITAENLDAIVARLAAKFGFSSSCDSVYYVIIPHIMLYPFYVQSYATSVTAAAEIYCLEAASEGSGLAVYTALIDRTGAKLDFEAALTAAGLPSPFEEGAIKELGDKLHYLLLGSHFYREADGEAA